MAERAARQRLAYTAAALATVVWVVLCALAWARYLGPVLAELIEEGRAD